MSIIKIILYLVIYLRKIIQYYISLRGKSMWRCRISSWREGEIRVRWCQRLIVFKAQADLQQHVFVEVCHGMNTGNFRGAGKGPQSDRWRKLNTTVTLSSRERSVTVCKVSKESRVTSKQIKTSLALTYVHAYESTIRRTLNCNGVHGRAARIKRKATALKKKGLLNITWAKWKAVGKCMWADKAN